MPTIDIKEVKTQANEDSAEVAPDIESEGELDQENETAPAPPADKAQEGKGSSPEEKSEQDDDNVPFHKHPRWKKIMDENRAMKNQMEELTKFKSEAAERLSRLPQNDAQVPIPPWFSKLYGDDAALWSEYRKYSAEERQSMKAELINEFRAEEQNRKAQETRWTEWVNSSLETLKDEGLKFDRNKLLKVAEEYLPTDAEGNVDFRKAHAIYQVMEKAEQSGKSAVRKQAASLSSPDSRPDSGKTGILTREQVKGMDYQELARMAARDFS